MTKNIPKNLQPFNNSGANEDNVEEEEGKDDGDNDDNTYSLRTRRRRYSRWATATATGPSGDAEKIEKYLTFGTVEKYKNI